MLTRVEIDGFKTFDQFSLDLCPFSAVVGPNASGKSNLFDAIRFLSLLAQSDVRSAMQGLRGKPEELFRVTPNGISARMSFAVEVLLNRRGVDAFGTNYHIKHQRLRYEIILGMRNNARGTISGIFVEYELCVPIAKKDDRASFLDDARISYSYRRNPFINMSPDRAKRYEAIKIGRMAPPKVGHRSEAGR